MPDYIFQQMHIIFVSIIIARKKILFFIKSFSSSWWVNVCHTSGPEKRHIPHKVVDSGNGVFRIEFTTVEVGSYVIDVTVASLSVPSSPLIAKAYDASLIKVTDICDGVVADLSTFRGESTSKQRRESAITNAATSCFLHNHLYLELVTLIIMTPATPRYSLHSFIMCLTSLCFSGC